MPPFLRNLAALKALPSESNRCGLNYEVHAGLQTIRHQAFDETIPQDASSTLHPYPSQLLYGTPIKHRYMSESYDRIPV